MWGTNGEWYERAQRVIPGGVHSPVRAFRAVGGVPRFILRGEGAYVWDVEDRAYIDYVMSWGALILGHAHPAVVAAAQRATARGSSYGMTTPADVELAELVASAFPFVERVRFVNSGTEATMTAVRIARAVTGRPLVIKFDGCYHGHADYFLVQAGSGALTLGVPSSPGVPATIARTTVSLPYNDPVAVERLFHERGDQVAAVIVEPIAGNMGLVLPVDGFLEALRDLTRRFGSLLIFDEVITGFRVGWGGWSVRTGIEPDLITLGKVIGGGFPLAAYAGPARWMDRVAPVGPVYQAGTLAGNPVAVAAGYTTLLQLQDDPTAYDALARRTRALAEGLQEAFQAHGVSAAVVWTTGMLSVFFRPTPPRNLTEVQASDVDAFRRFFHALLEQGVHLPPSAFEAWFLSLAHDDTIVTQTLEAVRSALPRMKDT
ncbi:MAG: glutamate-1-semialdehyde 2,1-aminomutase [Acidobacteria bacterium]|nr:glutamate-1-semialdehyde 2,1-aminomutase [Acidobacteriota bacterium]MDW7983522.1 glutamate-1-semialdehyde 2,1-aminomutase [Acidobacteriota bacterium]